VENIKHLERELKAAIVSSNSDMLDKLLADDVIFTNHLGQVVSKSQDIELHKAGLIKIESMETLEEIIHSYGSTVVVSTLLNVLGTFAGNNASGNFRFTRVWSADADGRWQVIAAHSSLIV